MLTLEYEAAGIVLPGAPVAIQASRQEMVARPVTLVAPATVHGRHGVRFVITGADGSTREVVESTFFGPMQ